MWPTYAHVMPDADNRGHLDEGSAPDVLSVGADQCKFPGRESAVKFFWEVFVTLFVIIDPVGTVPVFLGLTRDRADRDRNRLAWQPPSWPSA
jgi:MarC family integral membrane protein